MKAAPAYCGHCASLQRHRQQRCVVCGRPIWELLAAEACAARAEDGYTPPPKMPGGEMVRRQKGFSRNVADAGRA